MTKFYYTLLTEDWDFNAGYDPDWKTANTLKDALIGGRKLLMEDRKMTRMRYGSADSEVAVRIQTIRREFVGEKIPKSLIGDIHVDFDRKYKFVKYISDSFNKSPYCEIYILSADGTLKKTREQY